MQKPQGQNVRDFEFRRNLVLRTALYYAIYVWYFQKNEGLVPPKGDEDAKGQESRHHDDEDDYFEFVDAVEEKLIPDDDADYFNAKYTLNQTI